MGVGVGLARLVDVSRVKVVDMAQGVKPAGRDRQSMAALASAT